MVECDESLDFRFFLDFFPAIFFSANFFSSSGSSAFFRPHFCNSHEYHAYSSNWYPNFLWNFTSKSRVKVRLAIFSKFYRLLFYFYNLHIKPNVLNLTLFRRKMNPQKIATIEVGKKISKKRKSSDSSHSTKQVYNRIVQQKWWWVAFYNI